MGIVAAAVKHMLAADMPAEAIVAAVAEMEASLAGDEQAERSRVLDISQEEWLELLRRVFPVRREGLLRPGALAPACKCCCSCGRDMTVEKRGTKN